MGTALVGLAGVVLGILLNSLSDLFRSRTAFQREKAWDLLETKRRHIEATYEALELHRDAHQELLTAALLVLAGQKAPMKSLTRVPWPKLRMLVHLYLPEMLSELAAIEKSGNAFGTEASQVIGASGGAHSAARQQQTLQAFEQLHNAYDAFVVKLVGVGSALANAATDTTQGRLSWRRRPRPALSPEQPK